MSKARQKMRAEHNDPINFTCGICKQVHSFKKEAKDPYLCILKDEVKDGITQEDN